MSPPPCRWTHVWRCRPGRCVISVQSGSNATIRSYSFRLYGFSLGSTSLLVEVERVREARMTSSVGLGVTCPALPASFWTRMVTDGAVVLDLADEEGAEELELAARRAGDEEHAELLLDHLDAGRSRTCSASGEHFVLVLRDAGPDRPLPFLEHRLLDRRVLRLLGELRAERDAAASFAGSITNSTCPCGGSPGGT